MCGIFGSVGWTRELPPLDRLRRVTGLLRHRGPDEAGCWHEHNTFLGHCRLSIVDLTSGTQPMATADGRFVVTFNGEIYNHPELREELARDGFAFRTTSDTEVLLAAYAAWGVDAVARFEGMFALALYDRRERTLLLARDRFGEKPLFYVDDAGAVTFASELAPLVSIGTGARGLNIEALGAYLCLNYVPGDQTLLTGVRRVPPGTWRLYDADGLREQRRYFSPASLPPVPIDESRLLDDLQARLDHGVRLTLRSDVPVGLFLSGGIDSAIVAESAARQGRLEAAFCVDFAPGASEWERATHVARTLGIELVRVPMDGRELGEFLELVRHLDDPLADSSAIAVWGVARAARERVKVVLTGDGGDELFGGYPMYRASRWHQQAQRLLPRRLRHSLATSVNRVQPGAAAALPSRLARFLRALPLETGEAHVSWNGSWAPGEAALLARDHVLQQAARSALSEVAAAHNLPPSPSMHQLQLTDLTEYLVNDILAKVDRATMAHGLEARAPMLNLRVAEFGLSLPMRHRMRGPVVKVALRRLCARHFGDVYAEAPKRGFSIPVDAWLRTGGRRLMIDLLEPARVDALGVLDSARVTTVVRQHLAGAPFGWGVWGLMVLVAWHEQRVAGPPDARLLPDPPPLRALSLADVSGSG